MVGRGDMDPVTAGAASLSLRAQFGDLDRQLTEAQRRADAVADRADLAALPPERQRAIVGSLVRVVVRPAGRNRYLPMVDRLGGRAALLSPAGPWVVDTPGAPH